MAAAGRLSSPSSSLERSSSLGSAVVTCSTIGGVGLAEEGWEVVGNVVGR